MKTKPRKGEEFWRTQCSRWEQSGLTQLDYCATNKLNIKTFGRWRGRFKRLQSEPAKSNRSNRSSNAFVPVRLAPPLIDDVAPRTLRGEISLQLDGSKWVVKVQPGIDANALLEVLQAVMRVSP